MIDIIRNRKLYGCLDMSAECKDIDAGVGGLATTKTNPHGDGLTRFLMRCIKIIKGAVMMTEEKIRS